VMSFCYIIINILSVYSIMNEAEQSANKPILKIILECVQSTAVLDYTLISDYWLLNNCQFSNVMPVIAK